jgi:drug/metabolite transporter (DMT)-like permease
MFFLAIERLRLSTATVLNFASPVFVVILSGIFLRERGAFKVLPLVLAAFGGMAVMVAPEIGTLTAEILLGLASALFAALAYVTIRRLSRTESPATIVLYFSLWSTVFGAAALAISALAGWTEVGLGHIVEVLGDTREVLLLCGIGFCGTFGQMLLTSAYSRERASVVSPFSYLAPVFSYILGFVVFGEVPTVEGMLGGALVITASIGVLLFSREPVHRSDLRLDGEA